MWARAQPAYASYVRVFHEMHYKVRISIMEVQEKLQFVPPTEILPSANVNGQVFVNQPEQYDGVV